MLRYTRPPGRRWGILSGRAARHDTPGTSVRQLDGVSSPPAVRGMTWLTFETVAPPRSARTARRLDVGRTPAADGSAESNGEGGTAR